MNIKQQIDLMTAGYLACAAWSSHDTDPETGDDIESLECHQFSIEADREAREDCVTFLRDARKIDGFDQWSPDQAGHDFWLTRVGHGTGFWDRGLPAGDALTELSKSAGSVDIYIGDDGYLYFS